MKFKKPLLGFAAYSGTGKTTLLIKLLPLLKASGLRVAMIKHAHHDFDIDIPGKDSYELRKAGADQVLVASKYRRARVIETPDNNEPELADLINDLNLDDLDLILVEGFRHLSFPKIELHRPSMLRDLIYPDDKDVIAVVSDESLLIDNLPVFDMNKPDEVVSFIQSWLQAKNQQELG
ncbi:MAG: molybdopterin-guanine dinucleotide biosynthesis protein B [Gammaproteobacteria bacterium]|nr:molybdopterin-guanine dinucleotide biosynthesis protein B [Gammaproteobacteria bacterium]